MSTVLVTVYRCNQKRCSCVEDTIIFPVPIERRENGKANNSLQRKRRQKVQRSIFEQIARSCNIRYIYQKISSWRNGA